MKLTVYKGFDESFLEKIDIKPLVDNSIEKKLNVLNYDRKTRRQLSSALLGLEDYDDVWVTYEEFSLIKSRVDDAVKEDHLQLLIIRNNLYPDYYPLSFPITSELAVEITAVLNGDTTNDSSEACRRYLEIYNNLLQINDSYYGSFFNYEYNRDEEIKYIEYYPSNVSIEESNEQSEYNVFLNDSIETFIHDLLNLNSLKPSIIGLKNADTETSRRLQKTLQAYCHYNGIRIVLYHEKLEEQLLFEEELKDIAKNDLNIEGFSEFRKIPFYKNPDSDKDIVELSQASIIEEIIRQAERSYAGASGNGFRDIFITASTGAGKSVMFQIPAVYLAKKYHKLTIIIEPVKALMQDQKEKLQKNGYLRVEAFNSDLISQVEKEAVLQKVKNGEIDLLYLSPETLLSYSIETIIGDREIGLLIVDEAHIVTTWGVGFRPDYWYLGSYINRLRNQIQTTQGMKRKVYHFPICAFTATAINGGIDDSVSDTIISLYMENPIKYLGYVRRDDIQFQIAQRGTGTKLPKAEYEETKTADLNERIKYWLDNNEKTIVYFPYASLARDASKGIGGFAGIITDKRINTYTGKNIDELSNAAFSEAKKIVFEKFKAGTAPVMFATKAFGMGVDVNDVKNVYHYAVSGNLSDYVQEIGRAARKEGMQGYAITDHYYNDLTFMNVLFGMSQIRQYQIRMVLSGIYDVFKSKNENRNFLISPESFTYIFGGKAEQATNRLKICLLMLEKDFFDKYNFKVLISRPQSVFTKAFVCVNRENEEKVLKSKYGKCLRFVEKGRINEVQRDGSTLTDGGDVYSIDLKTIWEEFHPNISFPSFKYWYFNFNSTARDKVSVMPEIRDYIAPRQKVSIEARGEYLLSDLSEKILDDFEYIADLLHTEYRRQYFTNEDFAKLIRERYGMAKARIIANSLFELVDPDGKCIKRRVNDATGKTQYYISNGNFKELMRRPILRSKIISNMARTNEASSYSGFMSIMSDETSNTALKLLSIFDYITYEILGGEQPEIFIRLNDPNKVRSIVLGNTFYSNNYVTKAKQKHDRDVQVLLKFFNDLKTDEERWNYIENYFLGFDVLEGEASKPASKSVKMTKSIDKEHSYQTTALGTWDNIAMFFEDESSVLEKLIEMGLPIPEYLETTIKKSTEGKDIIMSWPSKDTLICQEDTSDRTLEYFESKGWHAYRIYEIDYEKIKGELS